MNPDPEEWTWQRIYHQLNDENRKKVFQFACELHHCTWENRIYFLSCVLAFLLVFTLIIPRTPMTSVIIFGGSLSFSFNLHILRSYIKEYEKSKSNK